MVVGIVEDGKEIGECLSGLVVADSASPDLTVAMFELVSVLEVVDMVPDGTSIEPVVAVEVSA